MVRSIGIALIGAIGVMVVFVIMAAFAFWATPDTNSALLLLGILLVIGFVQCMIPSYTKTKRA